MPEAPEIRAILDRALGGDQLARNDALRLMAADTHSDDCYAVMAAANQMTHRSTASHGTVYSQIGLNVWACPENCDFCYLGTKHRIVNGLFELPPEEVVRRALDFEAAGADEVYLMITANYPMERFLEIGRAVRAALRPQTELIANVGDFRLDGALSLLDAGFYGVYHVYRLREGVDTEIEPERRLATLEAIAESELDLRYCVEPVGPEHTDEEIVEQIKMARTFGAGIMAVMRRTPVVGTPTEHAGQLTEAEVAKIVAVARLTLGDQIRAMGVHEPSVVSLRAGAHRICAEVGMNPRDLLNDTSKGRGRSVEDCERLLWEAGFDHQRKAQGAPASC